jgi:ribonuclease VapC
MALDTSAIIAILLDEPERARFDRLIDADPVRLISAASRVEACLVIEGRKRAPGRRRLDRFPALTRAEVMPVTAEQAEVACESFRQLGKGRHPAGLDFGDCRACAPAAIEPAAR